MSNGEWLVVAGAAVPLAAALGTLLTWSLWREPPEGPRVVAALLGFHAGAALLAGIVATGAALRSWQLVDDGREQASGALLEVSHLDGDGSFYALVVLLLVPATALVVALLALTARFAASSHPIDRSIACAVIGVEIGAAGVGLAYVAGGSRSLLALVAVVHLPILMAAMVVTWPAHPDHPRGRHLARSTDAGDW